MKRPTLIVITGPTASGKSALAVSLAKVLDTEIISADSRQIFYGIPIATATPSAEERMGIPHHLMEILSLEDYYSASQFREDALDLCTKIFQDKETLIMCGGSMMYIDALVNGIDDLPTVPEDIRANLMEDWKTKGDEWLLQSLKNLDPSYYNKVDLKNLKRVFHAVEISITAGKSYSSLLSGNIRRPDEDLPFDIVKFCLNGDRNTLFERINARVIKMMESGLEEEAASVFPLRHLNSLNTVGLKEMFSMFLGLLNKEEAVAKIQKNTRVYAKKQLTWHKRDVNMKFIDFSDSHDENIRKILSEI